MFHHQGDKIPRLLTVLTGDMATDRMAQAKYGYLLEALKRQFPTMQTYDANLQGFMWAANILLSFKPKKSYWRQASWKNEFAFRARSRRVATHLQQLNSHIDVALQIGVLFDAHWWPTNQPTVIYTDYTTHLSSQRPESGRSPFTPRQLQRWIDLEKQAFERTTHVCSRSEVTRRSIIDDYHLDTKRVTTVGGGINFTTLPEPVKRTPHDRPTAVFIGHEFFRKGGDLVLKAFAKTRAQLPQARLLLLTRDTIPEGLPLDGVELVPFVWDRKMVENLYRQADVFVLPSRLETWGDVLLEAMAFNVPCIGVHGEAMDEIIVPQKTGLLVPPEDIDGLAEAMKLMLGNLPLCHQWGDAARQRVEQHFTWDHIVDQIAPFIYQAANNKR